MKHCRHLFGHPSPDLHAAPRRDQGHQQARREARQRPIGRRSSGRGTQDAVHEPQPRNAVIAGRGAVRGEEAKGVGVCRAQRLLHVAVHHDEVHELVGDGDVTIPGRGTRAACHMRTHPAGHAMPRYTSWVTLTHPACTMDPTSAMTNPRLRLAAMAISTISDCTAAPRL